MKRFIALALLFTTFISSTSCASKGNINEVSEKQFMHAISFEGVNYLQTESEDSDNDAIINYEITPNIVHRTHKTKPGFGDFFEEVYVTYKGGSLEIDDNFEGVKRNNPKEAFEKMKPAVAKDYYGTPATLFGKYLTEIMIEAGVTFKDFTFENNVYKLKNITLKFINRRLVYFTDIDAIKRMDITYNKKDIIVPKPGDKL